MFLKIARLYINSIELHSISKCIIFKYAPIPIHESLSQNISLMSGLLFSIYMVVWNMLYLFFNTLFIALNAFSGSEDLICALIAIFPTERHHTWKSWISSTLSMSIKSLNNSVTLISLGAASIRITMQSLKIGMVVNRQRKVNIMVHAGSA